jgi:hypothetical protein
MSTPPDKFIDTQEILYTQLVLSDVFAAPAVAQMQKSAEQFIKEGKFLNLNAEFQTMLHALWGRTMYAGISDAEKDTDAVKKQQTPKTLSYSRDNNLFSNQSLIEFAGRDPERERIKAEMKDLEKWRVEAAQVGDFEEVERIGAELSYRENLLKPKSKSKKSKSNASKILEVRSSAQKPRAISTTETTQASQSTSTSAAFNYDQKRKNIINSIRSRQDKPGVVLSDFDPRNTSDPYVDLYVEGDSKATAKNRLKQMDNLQIFATLNERYPALGQEGTFANDYLNRRVQTVATSLEKEYQERVKARIADYVKQSPNRRSQEKAISDIKDIYSGRKKKSFENIISSLTAKRDGLKISNEDYYAYINAQYQEKYADNSQISDPKELTRLDTEINSRESRIDKLVQEINELERTRPNSAKLNVKKALRLELATEVDGLEDRKFNLLNSSDKKVRGKNNLERHLEKVERFKNENPGAKVYTDPRKSVTLSDSEKNELAKLLNINPAELKDKKRFKGKELSEYINKLKRSSVDVNDELNQIASRTASTEVSAAYNIGRLQTYLSRGVKYVQWISTIDARTSVFCQSLHRRLFAINEVIAAGMGIQTFPNTRKPEYHPDNNRIKSSSGVTMWVPPAHPYCRSFLVPIYTDPAQDNYPDEMPPTSDLASWFLDRIRNMTGESMEAEIKYQEEIRQQRADALSLNLDSLHDIFNSGLSFLTRKINQDTKAKFTVDEVRKNDKRLAAALLGGAAVLGTGAMMYFFMKSNLGATVKTWLKTTTTTALGSSALAGLGEEAIRRLLRNLVRQNERLQNFPEAARLLAPSEEDIGDLLNDRSLAEKVSANQSRGEMAWELALRGEYDPDLLASQGVGLGNQGFNFQRDMQIFANQARLKSQLAYNRVSPVLNQMFSNKAGIINISDINKINPQFNTYNIVTSKGGSTFISRRAFDAVVDSESGRSALQNYFNELDDIETALDNLEESMGKADEITKANYRTERANVQKAKSIVNFALNKDSQIPAAEPEAFERLRERWIANEDIVSRAISSEGQLTQLADEVIGQLDSILPSNTLLNNLVPAEINNIAELKQVQQLIKNSLAEVRRDFLTKNQSYTLATAARKRSPEFSAQYNQLVLEIQNNTNLLNNSGLTYNNNISEIENYFKQRVNDKASQLIQLDQEISNRISQLQS